MHFHTSSTVDQSEIMPVNLRNRNNSGHKNKVNAQANSLNSPVFISSMSKIKESTIYDSYWNFAVERQNVFFARLEGKGLPWTNNPILQQFKFTNAYRASDRTSQFLIRNVIYDKNASKSPNETFFRIILFKLFNKIETWQLLEREFGSISFEEFSFERYDRVLSNVRQKGQAIYSSAYIMASGGSAFRRSSKHQNHLLILKQMMDDNIPQRIQEMNSMQAVYECLLQYPAIGEFLAFQYAIDLNYSELINFSEMEFVVPGPGAKDGISKCFADKGDLLDTDIIKLVAERQEEEFERRALDFKTLWGRKLQLIDCQNLFCEIDKYSRVAHPEIKGSSSRTRIKKKFVPTLEQINYFFPPKWKINDCIEQTSRINSNQLDLTDPQFYFEEILTVPSASTSAHALNGE